MIPLLLLLLAKPDNGVEAAVKLAVYTAYLIAAGFLLMWLNY